MAMAFRRLPCSEIIRLLDGTQHVAPDHHILLEGLHQVKTKVKSIMDSIQVELDDWK